MALNASGPLILGALPPPEGVTPNFVNPYSIQPALIGTLVAALSVSTIFVFLRMYTKLFIRKSTGLEDSGLSGALSSWLCEPELRMRSASMERATQSCCRIPKEILNAPVLLFTKASIFIQYIKIFIPNKKSSSYYVVQLLIWVNVFYYTSSSFALIFACSPRAKIWDPELPGHCINTLQVITITAGFNIASDLIMLLLPMIWIWRLQLATRRKFEISAVFLTGIFAWISSVLRLTTTLNARGNPDQTYALTPVAIWSVAEIAGGLVCSSLPILPRFFSHTNAKFKVTACHILPKPWSSFIIKDSEVPSAPSNSWQKPYASNPARANYRALQEQELAQVNDRPPRTEIFGSQNQQGLELLRRNLDLEEGGGGDSGSGIRKTVQLEQISS
ncbi:hypothetical protein MMC20_006950 [Loxospora ochrophaea]|nr:hypothetical protein [Loxospora ochrophaea]